MSRGYFRTGDQISKRRLMPSRTIAAETRSKRGLSFMPVRIQSTRSAGMMPSQYSIRHPYNGTMK